jgi:hypothetical protein
MYVRPAAATTNIPGLSTNNGNSTTTNNGTTSSSSSRKSPTSSPTSTSFLRNPLLNTNNSGGILMVTGPNGTHIPMWKLIIVVIIIMIGAYWMGKQSVIGGNDFIIGNSNSNTDETVKEELAEVVEPGTSLEELLDPSTRSQILDETEKAQGFSESYPSYDRVDKKEELEEAEQEKESEVLADTGKFEQVAKQDLKEEPGEVQLHGIRYVDQAEYDRAGYIKVLPTKIMRQPLWWAVKAYEKYYSSYPVKWYVPRLDPKVKLTPDLFWEHYRRHGIPVIINTESIRHLGFRTRKWTFDELRAKFPYNETKAVTIVSDYRANGIRREEEEIDLGPGLAAIVRDEKLAKQGVLRNYPRNLHVKPEALTRLEVDYPPLLQNMQSSSWQMPTLWLGTSSADTPWHHDCCDNFVLMLAGIKRFTLAPPTDWRSLSPSCVGPNKSLCWAKVSDPNSPSLSKKSQEIMSKVHKIIVDLQPGEILYMPAGWFHHVHNNGPTVMVNFWTRSKEQCGLVKAVKEHKI